MDVKATIISQYLAALEMLKQVIEKCPDAVWLNADHANDFWHVAYHALFYTHLYLQPQEADFTPWAKHRRNLNAFGPPPWAPEETVEQGEPFAQAEVLDYLALCQEEVQTQTAKLDLAAPSGFDWLPMNKLALQFYNIRHLQGHVGELSERLWVEANIEIHWVGQHTPA